MSCEFWVLSMLRADLHVHSWHSNVNGDLPLLKSRDCYSSPREVYRQARARGMDVVTITDHDSIDGCLELLADRPDARDIIIGEEISCWVPDTDLQVHLGAYGMTEAIHRSVQPLRDNVFDVAAHLRASGVFFALNHLLHFYKQQVPLEVYLRLLTEVPALEVRNGTMLAAHNAFVEWICEKGDCPLFRRRQVSKTRVVPFFAAVAGSDAHTLRRVGTTWTEAPGQTADEFLANVAAGCGRPGGAHGTALTIAGDAYGVICRYCKSLVGFGPNDHTSFERALYLATAVASIPFQWLPLAIALRRKRSEARHVRRCARQLRQWFEDANAQPRATIVRQTPGAMLADEEIMG
ncbi:MAG: PHP-associated domain-containing protein [Vicinamibacteraceae bacterium]